jgi:TrmH family RNA methyltransferase
MISSPQNETVKDIRRLRRSKGEHAVLEGPHLVREALEAGLELETVLVTPRFLETASGLALAPRLRGGARTVSEKVLDGLCDSDSPRGILAVTRIVRPTSASRAIRSDDVWLYLDGIQDPGNLGAIARVAEGLGATGLLLSPGTADPNHPRSLRGSAGSLLRLPVLADLPAPEAKRWSGAAPWIGLDAHGGATRVAEARVARPFVLAAGAEGQGLSAVTREALDLTISIPLAGRLESLNVAVATALALAELLRDGTKQGGASDSERLRRG